MLHNIHPFCDGVPAAIRIALLRQHGTSSQAYSATFQAGLEHFGDNRGFLAYKRVGRTALVLSDPLAPPENIPHLISRFLHENPDTCFWHLSPRVAQILAECGFYVNAMGPETWIDLPTYTFTGEKKKQLRECFNRMVSAVSSPANARWTKSGSTGSRPSPTFGVRPGPFAMAKWDF